MEFSNRKILRRQTSAPTSVGAPSTGLQLACTAPYVASDDPTASAGIGNGVEIRCTGWGPSRT